LQLFACPDTNALVPTRSVSYLVETLPVFVSRPRLAWPNRCTPGLLPVRSDQVLGTTNLSPGCGGVLPYPPAIPHSSISGPFGGEEDFLLPSTMLDSQMQSPLIQLPAELIQNILTFVPATSLASLAQTCHLLHQHTFDEKLWQAQVQQSLPGTTLKRAYPAASFRDLYITHHPYLFLPKYKIWFSDSPHTGKLLIARYSHSRQTVEAYALAAERGEPRLEWWPWKPDVIIHTFEPTVRLDLNQAVVRISPECMPTGSNRVQQEILMDTHIGSSSIGGIVSKFSHTRSLQPSAIGPGTQVWPPQTLPAMSRVRNASMEAFRGTGHRPSKLSEVSEHSFRLKRNINYNSQLFGLRRVGEDVHTFATLPPDCYTPTKQKPWRGIWVGDYSGHGCEFLAVLQPDEPQPLPESALDAFEHNLRSASPSSDASWQTALSTVEATAPVARHLNDEEADTEDIGFSGQLMAVKLTGEMMSHPHQRSNFN
jgi:hypothetical protein